MLGLVPIIVASRVFASAGAGTLPSFLCLGQIPRATTEALGSTSVTIAAIMAIVYLGIKLTSSLASLFGVKPDPAKTYVRIGYCKLLHGTVNDRLSGLEAADSKLRDDIKEDFKGAQERINLIMAATERIEGKLS